MVGPSLGSETPSSARACGSSEYLRRLERVDEVVVLSGSVRAQPWVKSLGISPLDLPLDRERRLIDQWSGETRSLAGLIGRGTLTTRVLIDKASKEPASPTGNGSASMVVERDPNNLRGTGGVLKDIASRHEPDHYLLVVNGAQVLLEPLADLAVELAAASEHVSLVSHGDGTPSGVMLVRCGVFDLVDSPGFVDMKEQVLPLVAREYSVGVVHREGPTGLAVRRLADYLSALRAHHRLLARGSAADDPYEEQLKSTFGIVQAGAEVNPTAYIHDSVVLSGGKVGAGAIVVRSVVTGSGRVGNGERAVGRLVRGENGHGRSEEGES